MFGPFPNRDYHADSDVLVIAQRLDYSVGAAQVHEGVSLRVSLVPPVGGEGSGAMDEDGKDCSQAPAVQAKSSSADWIRQGPACLVSATTGSILSPKTPTAARSMACTAIVTLARLHQKGVTSNFSTACIIVFRSALQCQTLKRANRGTLKVTSVALL